MIDIHEDRYRRAIFHFCGQAAAWFAEKSSLLRRRRPPRRKKRAIPESILDVQGRFFRDRRSAARRRIAVNRPSRHGSPRGTTDIFGQAYRPWFRAVSRGRREDEDVRHYRRGGLLYKPSRAAVALLTRHQCRRGIEVAGKPPACYNQG